MELINQLHQVIVLLNGLLWGPVLIVILFAVHLFFTVRLRFIQRCLPLAFKITFQPDLEGRGEVSHWSALNTALAATIGAGSILGVAAALTLGGPGALFWMWVAGALGIATKYAEALLAVKYRVKTRKGTILGGPMYVLENGMHRKWMATAFSYAALVAAFTAGNMVPAISLSTFVYEHYEIDLWVTGTSVTVLAAVIVAGGLKSISQSCRKILPATAAVYAAGCIVLLAMNWAFIIPALKLCVASAFSVHAAGSGFAGAGIITALRFGMLRGGYPVDAGLGSAPIAAAAARSDIPVRQALVASTGTFWDTVVMCGLSALVMVTGMLKNPEGVKGLESGDMAAAIFSQFQGTGPFILMVCLLLFIFSTVLGWSYYGERAVEYLFHRKAIPTYRYFWIIALFFGAMLKAPDESAIARLVIDLATLSVCLMAIPNLVSLVYLNRTVVAETQKFLWDKPAEAPSEENAPADGGKGAVTGSDQGPLNTSDPTRK